MATTNRFYLQYAFMNRGEFPLPDLTNESIIKEIEEMEVTEDDIFIVTYPKSGTHWMQEIVHLILVNGYAESITSEKRRPVIELADVMYSDPGVVAAAGPVLRELKDMASPRVLSTHLNYPLLPIELRGKRPKLIYVYRHPKDVIISYYNFFQNFVRSDITPAPFEDFFDDILSGHFEYGTWFDHVMEYYTHKDELNILALSFEEMKQDLHKVVQDVASFIGKPVDDVTLKRVVEGATFEAMKQSFNQDHDENIAEGKDCMKANIFLRNGKVGQWKATFTAEQNKRFDQIFQEKMKGCEWTRSYELDTASNT